MIHKNILMILFLFISNLSISQVIIGNGATLKIQNGGKMIVNNPIPNGMTGGSTGGIITEGEDAEVILKTGTSTGTYNIPFSTANGVAIPFKYIITSAGTGSGEVRFSSWGTSPTNNPLPASVTYFTDNDGYDNSYSVMDRFWSIRPVNYTVRPRGTYVFAYDVNEIQSPNTIVESSLVAQRWNDVDDLWGDWLYSNTANTSNRTITVIISNPEDEYDIWTLTDQTDPLPIELASFTVYCDNGKINLEWTTYTETDNLYFVIERSRDGYSFEEVVQVDGAINSNSIRNYSHIDMSSDIINYYRLKSISTEGDISYSQVINVSCRNPDINVFPNPTNGGINITGITDHKVEIFDSKGSIVSRSNTVKDLSSGKYILVIRNDIDYRTFQIIKR